MSGAQGADLIENALLEPGERLVRARMQQLRRMAWEKAIRVETVFLDVERRILTFKIAG